MGLWVQISKVLKALIAESFGNLNFNGLQIVGGEWPAVQFFRGWIAHSSRRSSSASRTRIENHGLITATNMSPVGRTLGPKQVSCSLDKVHIINLLRAYNVFCFLSCNCVSLHRCYDDIVPTDLSHGVTLGQG